MASAAGWHKAQRLAILIPCLVCPAQEAIHMLLVMDVANYKKVRDAILQTLYLSSEM